jgi:hypothetical protein
MMPFLRDQVLRHATGRSVITVFLVNLGFMLTFTWLDQGLQAIAPGAVTPDVLGFVNAVAFLQAIEALGNEGRDIYLTFNLIDMAYPIAYSSLLLLLMGWGLRDRLLRPGLWPWMLLLPILAITGDYLENTTTRILVSQWPDGPHWAVSFALAGHWLKWAMLIPAALFAAWGLATGLKARRETRGDTR